MYRLVFIKQKYIDIIETENIQYILLCLYRIVIHQNEEREKQK